MDIYFYSSYEGSSSGFVLQKYNRVRLILPEEGADSLPFREVCNFFAYDVFQILWKDFTEGERRGLSLTTSGSILGIRGLKGKISNREAVINLAFTAEKEETAQVFGILQNFLWDFKGYTRALFACMKLGEAGECQIEQEAFDVWISHSCSNVEQLAGKFQKAGFLPGFMNRMAEPHRVILTEKELIRFAVCVSDWKNAKQYLGSGWFWRFPPEGALDSDRFEELFLKRQKGGRQ